MVQTCPLAMLDVITRHHRHFGTQGTVVSTPDNYNSSPKTAEARAIFPPSPATIRRRASMSGATSTPNMFSSDAAARVLRSRLRARGRRSSAPSRNGVIVSRPLTSPLATVRGVGECEWLPRESAAVVVVSSASSETHALATLTPTPLVRLPNAPKGSKAPPRLLLVGGSGTQRAARLPTMRKPSTSRKSPQTRNSPNPNEGDQRTWSEDGTRLVSPTHRGTTQTSQAGLPMPPTTGTRTRARTRGGVVNPGNAASGPIPVPAIKMGALHTPLTDMTPPHTPSPPRRKSSNATPNSVSTADQLDSGVRSPTPLNATRCDTELRPTIPVFSACLARWMMTCLPAPRVA